MSRVNVFKYSFNQQNFRRLQNKVVSTEGALDDTKLKLKEWKSKYKKLEKEYNELQKKLKEEENRADEAEDIATKNSTNSSVPKSKEIVPAKTGKKEKTGANMYSNRKDSNKLPGGQFGHEGTNLSKNDVEELKKKGVETRVEYKYIYGSFNEEDIHKYQLGMAVKPYIKETIFKHTPFTNNVMPEEYYTDVTYDNSIKALAIELGQYNIVPYERLADFFNVVTDGVITISKATLINISKKFSKLSEQSLKNIEEGLLKSKIMGTDGTGTKLNGKNIETRCYDDGKYVRYMTHTNKGHKGIKDDNILPLYKGGIMGDHETCLFKYGTKHYECIVHVNRYLEEIIQKVPKVKWPKKMKKLFYKMNAECDKARKKGLESLSTEKIEEFENKYDEILKLAMEETSTITSELKHRKSKRLSNRLGKYKEFHTGFIHDLEVTFSNNRLESDLRIYKTKTKVSGGFRSLENAKYYANTLSIIQTAKRYGMNPYDAINAIFNGEVLFSS